jgi:hypothetical protein
MKSVEFCINDPHLTSSVGLSPRVAGRSPLRIILSLLGVLDESRSRKP